MSAHVNLTGETKRSISLHTPKGCNCVYLYFVEQRKEVPHVTVLFPNCIELCGLAL